MAKDYEDEDNFDEDVDEDDDFNEKDDKEDKKESKKEVKKEEKKEEVKKEEKSEEKKEAKPKKSKMNYWQIAAICLGILLLVSFYFNLNRAGPAANPTGTLVSKDAATSKALKVINDDLLQPGMSATIVNSSEKSGLYMMTLSINGNKIPAYVSSDGKLFFTNAIDLENVPKASTATTQPANIPKTDKPVVELFVMSYCPYGTQAEKGIMPAIDALGSNVDFKVRFVSYSMHGEKEIKENLLQYCLEKEQSTKYFKYLSCFLDKGDSASCLTTAGIDQTKLDACTKATDALFNVTALMNDQKSWAGGKYPKFMIDGDLNDKYGVQGSPTLIINGVESSAGRDPESYLKAICGAYTTAPDACSTQISTKAYQPAFGYDYATTGAGQATCG